MSLSAPQRIHAARELLDNATKNVAAYVARRDQLGDTGNVPMAEVQQIRDEIEICRMMLDTLRNVALEVTHG